MNGRTVYKNNPYKNSEGYPDPTAFHAIRRCCGEQSRSYMPIVLLYSTERDSEEQLVKDGSCLAIRENCIPVAPQLICINCFRRGNKVSQVKARQNALMLLSKCRELWILGEGEDPFSARLIDKALQKGIRIRFYTGSMTEVGNV